MPGVEHLPGHGVRGAVHRPLHRRAAGGAHPQPRDGGEAVGEHGRVDAQPLQHVERLGGDAVAADLVAGEVGAVQQQDAGRRRGPAGGQRRGGTGRSGPDDDDVPVLHGSDATAPADRVLLHRPAGELRGQQGPPAVAVVGDRLGVGDEVEQHLREAVGIGQVRPVPASGKTSTRAEGTSRRTASACGDGHDRVAAAPDDQHRDGLGEVEPVDRGDGLARGRRRRCAACAGTPAGPRRRTAPASPRRPRRGPARGSSPPPGRPRPAPAARAQRQRQVGERGEHRPRCPARSPPAG